MENSNEKEQWYPTKVEDYRQSLIINSNKMISKEKSYKLRSNMAYSFQYLEYILKQLKTEELTSVLKKMLYKSFIINGMSIVESTFYALLLNKEEIKPNEWKEYASFSNKKIINDDKLQTKVETHIFKEIEENDREYSIPTLDSMIKKMQKKGKKKDIIYGLTKDDYPVLKNLRKLRNHVHLQSKESETDYNSFSDEEVSLMSRILFHIFGSEDSTISNNKKIFAYLFID